jgi:hypothetical protein
MYNAYWAKHDKIAGQDIKNFFQPDGGYSPRDNAIFEWILLIVKNSLHSIVDDKIWRIALKHGADLFSTHPILLEAILFLLFNQKYWTLFKESQAIKSVQNEESSKRYKKEAGRFGILDMHYYQKFIQ